MASVIAPIQRPEWPPIVAKPPQETVQVQFAGGVALSGPVRTPVEPFVWAMLDDQRLWLLPRMSSSRWACYSMAACAIDGAGAAQRCCRDCRYASP
ncbi:MAG: hypothetical protein R2856_04530 [Caldilineaceae bacterium]